MRNIPRYRITVPGKLADIPARKRLNRQAAARVDHPLAGAAFGPIDDRLARFARLQSQIAIAGRGVFLDNAVLSRQGKTIIGGIRSEDAFAGFNRLGLIFTRSLDGCG